ncbi:GNAT family N-acetyltransferase [Brevibacillus migulae]|uniref:GNAT family N-acetyltransferase n=1 Tax=Brevibacillus migulae TaxID=1644114 RepID=UPI00106DE7E5|nr:GNAT family N-acetyltransferase [Brevibacillus migulae]
MSSHKDLAEIFRLAAETDLTYIESFAKRGNYPWGVLFWNADNPTYYDANHAHIFDPVCEAEQTGVIEEVRAFYQAKNIIPRFYLYGREQHQSLIEQLKAKGFCLEELENPIQVWSGAFAQVDQNPAISIEEVTDANYSEALKVECSIQELGGQEVREQAFAQEYRHPGFQHYLLRLNGVPVSVACTFTHGSDVRVESVATLREYRGQGLIGHLLLHIQQVFAQSAGTALWVHPINHLVEKVYKRYGFKTVGEIILVHAYAGGKGIKEIREEQL